MDMAGELLCPLKEVFLLHCFMSVDCKDALRRSKNKKKRHQPRLSFTKPLKLGHLGVCSLENDSLALHYLSEDFILLLTAPSSPLPLLSSFFLRLHTPHAHNVPPGL